MLPTVSDLERIVLRLLNISYSDSSHNDLLFVRRVYAEGIQKYVDRLSALGFGGKEIVLDAGCGFGQWSLALSLLNDCVESCDVSPVRVQFLREVAVLYGRNNITAQVCPVEVMPYPDSSFDAVFCYGTIFLTPWRKSLAELLRVLKPGGLLYVNANGLGWYIFLWDKEYNKADDYDPKAIAARAFVDTLAYERHGVYEPGMNLLIDPEDLKEQLLALSFDHIRIAGEGQLHLDHSVPAPIPFFHAEYKSQLGVYEIVASKQ